MKSYVLRFALLAFAIYLVCNCVSLQVELINEKRTLAEEKSRITETQEEIERLNNLLENGNDSEFIEDAARERLGYVFPNEDVYKSVTGN